MINTINSQLELVNQSLDWVKTNLQPNSYQEFYKGLIDCRRQLNRILFALSEKPAVALYGESQKGKSYLANSLLSILNNSFCVIDESDNTSYDFINEINPYGKNNEATSIVTRFMVNGEVSVDPGFPVKIKLLSVSDIISVFCEAFYNNVIEADYKSTAYLNEKLEKLQQKYQDNDTQQKDLTEDDVLNIYEYINNKCKNNLSYLKESDFFNIIPEIIHKIPCQNWPEVFSLLWHESDFFTNHFKKLLSIYEQLHFTNECYIPIRAVLRKHGTLLHVDRLKHSYEDVDEKSYESLVKIAYQLKGKKHTTELPKSDICAIAGEVNFKIKQETTNGTSITDEKPFLKEMDLLDFPGARSSEDVKEKTLNQEIYPQVFLRGKVAYLFNKYSELYLFTNLLFCHDNEMRSQATIPTILNDWVTNYIGKDKETRSMFLRNKISPLFIIATKFNTDLEYDSKDFDIKSNQLNPDFGTRRWRARFMTVLENEMLRTQIFSWFNNWTNQQNLFSDIYFLRDFVYSSELHSKIFTGYDKVSGKNEKQFIDDDLSAENETPTRRNMKRFVDDLLKKSFLEFTSTWQHFEDPLKSWNAAAQLNCDGSQFIIERLSEAAQHAIHFRRTVFSEKLLEIKEQIQAILEVNYQSEDGEEMIRKAIEKSGKMTGLTDSVWSKDKYFFGRMIQFLQINEYFVYDTYKDLIASSMLIDNKEVEKYTLIVERCRTEGKEFDAEPTIEAFDNNVKILQQVYKFSSSENARQYFEETLEVNLKLLFSGNFKKPKSKSVIMAEEVISKWISNLSSEKQLSFFYQQGLTKTIVEQVVKDFIENIEKLCRLSDLIERIAEAISKYTDTFIINERILPMISDITSKLFNQFILCMGYDFMSDTKKEELKLTCKQRKIHFKPDYEEEGGVIEEEQLLELFDINNSYSTYPFHENYNKWINFLRVSYLATCKLPSTSFDPDANRQLGVILKDLSEIN